MAEYIDRKQISYTWWQKQDGTFSDGVTLQSIINDMPTADVVSVVRCKDCGHYNGKYCVTLPSQPIVARRPDDYCSYGERKENEGT